MKHFNKITISWILIFAMSFSQNTRADLFGSDTAVLVQILTNAIRQLTQLQQILGTNSDTLRLLREVNRGIKDGLDVIRILDPKFNPGLYGDLQTVDRVLKSIEDLYGAVPLTAEARLQTVQDLSASESIAMNGTLFRYADQVDRESHRIFEHSQNVNPQGAAKLTAQSVAVLIGVTTQVLRTNSMMLKLMGQNMALSNRKDKIQAAQFRTQYQELSTALSGLKTGNKLSTLRGGL